MRWIVLASAEQKDELLSQGVKQDPAIEWIKDRGDFNAKTGADVFFDLAFENKPGETEMLKQLLPKPVIINNVLLDNPETAPFISLHGWPTFLKRETTELRAEMQYREATEKAFALLNRKVSWCNDAKSFISARVTAMIINEAYMALEENVSTREEIDIAMKLGTNYPFGPFEWAQKIGHERIVRLLDYLSQSNKIYEPCRLLKEEINKN